MRVWIALRGHVRSATLRLVAPITLVAVAFVWFAPLLLGRSFSPVPFYQELTYPWRGDPNWLNGSWVQFDAAASGFPMWQYLHDTMVRGDAPLWETHSFLTGYPIAADGLSGYLYPPRLLLAATVDASWAHDLYTILNVVGGGLLAYLFFRRVAGSWVAAMLGGLTWMFCAWTAAFQQLDMLAPAILLLPATLLTVDIAVRGHSWSWVVVAGWAMGVSLIAGNIVDMLLVFWTAALYGAGLAAAEGWRRVRHPDARKALARLALTGLLAGCAGAAITLPTILNAGRAERLPMTWDVVRDSQTFPLSAYLGWILEPPMAPIDVNELSQMVWIGPLGLGVAVLGLACAGGRLSWFGRLGALVALAIATGGPLAWIAYQLLPPFKNLASYARLNVIISFALVALAVAGASVLERTIARAAGRVGFRRGKTIAWLSIALLMTVNTGLLLSYTNMVNPPFLEREKYPSFPPTAAGLALQTELEPPGSWPGIVLPVAATRSDGLWPGWVLGDGTALVLGIGSAGGYDSLVPRRTATIVRLLAGGEEGGPVTSGVNPRYSSDAVPWDLVARLGITHVFSTPSLPAELSEDWGDLRNPGRLVKLYDGVDGRLWGVPGSRPGPYIARRSIVAATPEEALGILTGDDWTDGTAVLEATADEQGPATGGAEGEVLSAAMGTNGASIRVRASKATWVVVPVSYDEGWTASVDGTPAPVVPANVSRIAVPIPAGEAQVELRYRPNGLVPGLALTAIAVLVSLVVWLRAMAVWLRTLVRGRRGGEVHADA